MGQKREFVSPVHVERMCVRLGLGRMTTWHYKGNAENSENNVGLGIMILD